MLVMFFPAALIHEMGHILVGWTQGARGAQIRFGSPRHKAVTVRLPAITLTFHLGLQLWFTAAIYHFDTVVRRTPWARLLRAIAGPMASAACVFILRAQIPAMIAGPGRTGYFVYSWATALTWWSAMFAVFPLMPLHYRDSDIDSDGLTIITALMALFKRS